MNFTISDVVITAFFTGIIAVAGFIFKYFLGRMNKNTEEKDNRVFNELMKLAASQEKMNCMIMEMKADMPKSYATKEDLKDWINNERSAHDTIHRRIDSVYEKKETTDNR